MSSIAFMSFMILSSSISMLPPGFMISSSTNAWNSFSAISSFSAIKVWNSIEFIRIFATSGYSSIMISIYLAASSLLFSCNAIVILFTKCSNAGSLKSIFSPFPKYYIKMIIGVLFKLVYYQQYLLSLLFF